MKHQRKDRASSNCRGSIGSWSYITNISQYPKVTVHLLIDSPHRGSRRKRFFKDEPDHDKETEYFGR